MIMSCLLVGVLSRTLMAYSGGTGEANDPYQIATAADLIELGNAPNDYNDCFVLTADIDLSGYRFDRAVIAPDVNDLEGGFQGTCFNGRFDGQGHAIRHLSIQDSGYLGLFGQCWSEAIIANLVLEAVDINGTGDYVGGLVGYNWGTIRSSYSTGNISGRYSTGGLVGENDYGTITSSYSTGVVHGKGEVGGLMGDNSHDTITSCFWDTETSGQSNSAGGTGLTTAQMQDLNTFLDAGWDFVGETANGTEDIWVMPENSYPRLWWQE